MDRPIPLLNFPHGRRRRSQLTLFLAGLAGSLPRKDKGLARINQVGIADALTICANSSGVAFFDAIIRAADAPKIVTTDNRGNQRLR